MSPTPRTSKPKGPRVSGEAFRRVDDEIWSKEIIEGLEDNSCKLHNSSQIEATTPYEVPAGIDSSLFTDKK